MSKMFVPRRDLPRRLVVVMLAFAFAFAFAGRRGSSLASLCCCARDFLHRVRARV